MTPHLRPDDPLLDERLTLVGLLHEVATGLEERFREGLRGCTDLTMQHFELLMRLARSPGGQLRMSDLAAQTKLTPSGLTRAVDRLEDLGLVERSACPTDRRGWYAGITDAGTSAVRSAAVPHLDTIQAHVVDVLAPDEQAGFEAVLRKLRDHVNPDAARVTP